MDRSASVVEMQKFQFGNKILCTDGEEGTLVQVIFDASTRALRAIGIKFGFFFSRTAYVPFSAIRAATGTAIELSFSRAEMTGSSSEQPGGVKLDSRSVVQNKDTADRGALKLVAVQPQSGELSYLVTHALRASQDTLLRQDVIKEIAPDLITVSLPEATLQVLPPYRSDQVLQEEVERILFELAPLHVDLEGLVVRVLDGVLYLEGNTSSTLRGEIAADQSSGVPGLLEVRNQLVGDDQLASDLALALGHDARTRGLPIGVYPRLGVVRLGGVAHNEQQKVVAEEIARKFVGVRSVTNALVVKPKTDALGVLAPAVDGDTPDMVPGKYIRHTK
jgi:osmotically-inducible protein OsmY